MGLVILERRETTKDQALEHTYKRQIRQLFFGSSVCKSKAHAGGAELGFGFLFLPRAPKNWSFLAGEVFKNICQKTG